MQSINTLTGSICQTPDGTFGLSQMLVLCVLCHNMCDMRKRIIISTTMKKTNKIIPLDVRGTTKTATELTSQELEALQYMKKCGKLDMVNVQKQADMIKRNEYLSMNVN